MQQSGQLLTTMWLDNKEVQVVSTNVQPNDRGTVSRMQANSTIRDIEAPSAVITYNKWMGGVDRGDPIR